jgi:hypothetical protein
VFFGAYFGLATSSSSTPPETPLVPVVAVTTTTSSDEYVDHVASALDRLPEQFKTKNT